MQNITNTDLNLFVTFHAIYEERSVTRAAERLRVTQPTASGMLRRLREVFRDPLFLRVGHGLIPTPRADELAGPVRAMLLQADTILSPALFDPAQAEVTFRLSGSDYMQQSVIVPAILRVRQAAPKCRIAAMPRTPHRLAQQLETGEVDACICSSEHVMPNMAAEVLFRDRYVCVGRKEHRVRDTILTIEKLLEFDHLLVDPSGSSFVGPVDHALSASGRTRRVAATFPTFSKMIRVLLSDDFLSFIPARLAASLNGEVRVFGTDLQLPEFEVVATWHPRFDHEQRHLWLRSLLREVCNTEAGAMRTGPQM
jgi:DNA-binding transcriptional LysR family regulator